MDKVLVCGGRDFDDHDGLYHVMDALAFGLGISLIIHGGARGADSLAGKYGREHGIPVSVYPADWNAHGRAAGPIRNAKMLAESQPDLVVAFPGGRGTADMVARAKAAGVKVINVTGSRTPSTPGA